MQRMDKEIRILARITDNCGNSKKTVESLQKEIISLKNVNKNLEEKVEFLEKNLEFFPIETSKKPEEFFQNTRKTPNFENSNELQMKSSAEAEDLKILDKIMNLVVNNPGIMTIILQELKGKLSRKISLQIFENMAKINKKFAEEISSKKNEKNEKTPKNHSISARKTQILSKTVDFSGEKREKQLFSEEKTRKTVKNLKNPNSSAEKPVKKTADFQLNSEIEQKLNEFQSNFPAVLEFQKLNEEGYYRINKRKVMVQLINTKLVVRVGGGFLQIKDFLEFETIQTMKKKQRLFNEKSV